MHLGLFTYNVEYGARPDDLARAAEERGFESIWVGEHTHKAARLPIPAAIPFQSHTTIWPTPSFR